MSEELTEYVKSDGETIVKINDSPATIAKAKELGWKPAKAKAKEKPAEKPAEKPKAKK